MCILESSNVGIPCFFTSFDPCPVQDQAKKSAARRDIYIERESSCVVFSDIQVSEDESLFHCVYMRCYKLVAKGSIIILTEYAL